MPGFASPLLGRLPVELLSRKHGSPLEKRCPDAERGRAGGVVDEIADEPLDARTFEHKDHGLFGEKDTVPPKAGQCEPVGCALGEDLSGSLTRAWHELPNDRHALVHVVINNPSFGALHRSRATTEAYHDGDCSNLPARELTVG